MGAFLSLRVLGPFLATRRLTPPRSGGARRSPESILVIRLDDIGDMVLFTPFLRELRRLFPGARITLVVKPLTRNLVDTCPHVDEVLIFSPWREYRAPFVRRYRDLLAFCRRELWSRRYDLAIHPRWDCDYYNAYHLLYLSGAPRRVAYPETATDEKRRNNRGCDRLATELVPPSGERHEVLRNLAVLRHLGGTPERTDLELWLTPEDRAFAESFLGGAGGRVVSIGIGAQHAAKRWPAERFLELGRRLLEDGSLRILLVGGPADREACETLARQLGDRALSAAGPATLRQTAALLERAALHIGNDSGPKHLAAAVRTPVVEVSAYPEGSDEDHFLSPSRFGPWGIPAITVHPGTAAFFEGSIGLVPVDRVHRAALDLLGTGRT